MISLNMVLKSYISGLTEFVLRGTYLATISRREEVIRMPGGDGTGPAGLGPRTGRGAGYCAGFPYPGYANTAMRLGMAYRRGSMQMPFSGRGFRGRGMGFGRGGCRRARFLRWW
jgi:hypothetical protein